MNDNRLKGDPSARPGSAECYSASAKVLDLVERYQTPPDPTTYAVWYAYALGRNKAVVKDIDKIVENNKTISKYEMQEIFSAHIGANQNVTVRDGIGAQFREQIEGVSELIKEGMSNNTSFGEKLSGAEEALPQDASPESLRGFITTLLSENQRMISVTTSLNDGLQQSQRQVEKLNMEVLEFQNQSLRDALTEIANRRAFDQRLTTLWDSALETGESLCLAIVDIDHFKRVNDTFGHQVGDSVLRLFASILSENTKGQDMVARYGGEEFAIILPNTDILSAYNLMVKIRHRIEQTQITLEGSKQSIGKVTASFGVSTQKPGMTAEDLIQRADKKLYEAKNAGRNRVKADGLD